MRFNLVHVIASRRDYHGLLGYREVIESVQWGLEALGHQVTFTTNKILDCSNIIFGQQMLNEETLASLPANTICYNMEQIAGATAAEIKPELHTTARLFQVWDYSRDNLAAWESLNPLRRPIHVPIGYAPVLSRIPHQMNPYIDVLFYGFPTAGRLELFARLCDMGLHSVFVCGLYGRERDELIERSKVILNYNAYDKSRVFEIARVSYLLANGKAVVSDLHPETRIEPDMMEAVALATVDKIPETCQRLVDDVAARHALESKGREIFQQRDVRTFLARALAEMGLK